MGSTLTKVTTNTGGTIDCTKDADCYAANSAGSKTVATTDADKNKRCCMYYELMKEADNTVGKATQTLYTTYGYPLGLNKYSKICNYNYPSTITNASTGGTYDAAKGIFTADATNGKYELKEYCDGGAAALAVASAAVAAITVSLY